MKKSEFESSAHFVDHISTQLLRQMSESIMRLSGKYEITPAEHIAIAMTIKGSMTSLIAATEKIHGSDLKKEVPFILKLLEKKSIETGHKIADLLTKYGL